MRTICVGAFLVALAAPHILLGSPVQRIIFFCRSFLATTLGGVGKGITKGTRAADGTELQAQLEAPKIARFQRSHHAARRSTPVLVHVVSRGGRRDNARLEFPLHTLVRDRKLVKKYLPSSRVS